MKTYADILQKQSRFTNPVSVHYAAKIRIPGVSVCARIAGDTVSAITPEEDHGFKEWLDDNSIFWMLADTPTSDVYYYGTWAGVGIGQGYAVNQLDHRYLFLTHVVYNGHVVVAPNQIEEIMPEDSDDVLTLPWDRLYTDRVDFSDPEAAQTFGDMIDEHVKVIGAMDPFINGIFGIEGTGAGWHMMPMCDPYGDPLGDNHVSDLWFEALSFEVPT